MLTQPRAAVPVPRTALAPAPPAAPAATRPSTPRPAPPTRSRWLWVLPVLLAAALGLYRASSIVLWWDELSTLDIAERPVGGILATARNVDAVHTSYYLFMHFWIAAFGDSALALRLPSVLAMCGATACTSAIAQRLFNRRVALTASTVFALIPGVARYAGEARSYGFVVLGATAAFLLLLRALERPDRRRWAAYGAMLAATGALNLIALTAVAGHVVAALVRSQPAERRRLLKPFAIAVAAALLIDSPIIVYGILEAHSQLGDLPSASVSDLPSMWRDTGCSTAVAVLVLMALPQLANHRRRGPELTILACATLPVLSVWTVSLFGIGFDTFARYLLFVLPAWAIAVAVAADRLWPARDAVLLAVILVTAVVVTHDQIILHGQLSHFDFDYPGPAVGAEDYPAAASIVEAGYRPGDAATFSASPHLDLGVNDYLPADEQLRDVFVAQTDVRQHSLTPEFCASTAACLAKAPDRIWMFETGFDAPFTTERADWALSLMLDYRIVEVWHVEGITITLLER